MVRARGTDSARVIQVIETNALRGDGTQDDPCRIVKQYWDFDGILLAENDPVMKEKGDSGKQFLEWVEKFNRHFADRDRRFSALSM